MGPLLRPHCGQLCGVDLSPGMVGKARQRCCYDELAVGELLQYLQDAQAGEWPLRWLGGCIRPVLFISF
jgi:predicted TPR repeat methyltransferase